MLAPHVKNYGVINGVSLGIADYSEGNFNGLEVGLLYCDNFVDRKNKEDAYRIRDKTQTNGVKIGVINGVSNGTNVQVGVINISYSGENTLNGGVFNVHVGYSGENIEKFVVGVSSTKHSIGGTWTDEDN